MTRLTITRHRNAYRKYRRIIDDDDDDNVDDNNNNKNRSNLVNAKSLIGAATW